MQQLYYTLIDHEERTTYTVSENNFVASLESFLKQTPSRENIRAVVKTYIWIIDKQSFKQLQVDIPAFKDFYISLLENEICCIDESRINGIILTPQQQYEKLMKNQPEVIQQIPLQFLASIIGVTPRHLSRLRKNI